MELSRSEAVTFTSKVAVSCKRSWIRTFKQQSTNRKWYAVRLFNNSNCDDLGCTSRSFIVCKLFYTDKCVSRSLCHSRASCISLWRTRLQDARWSGRQTVLRRSVYLTPSGAILSVGRGRGRIVDYAACNNSAAEDAAMLLLLLLMAPTTACHRRLPAHHHRLVDNNRLLLSTSFVVAMVSDCFYSAPRQYCDEPRVCLSARISRKPRHSFTEFSVRVALCPWLAPLAALYR